MRYLLFLVLTALAPLVATAQATDIKLKNGTVIKGAVTAQDETHLTIEAELIGTIRVARADLAAPPDSPAAPRGSPATPAPSRAVQDLTAPPAAAVAHDASKRDPSKPSWKRTLSLSGNYQSANFKQGALPGNLPAGLPATGAGLGLEGGNSMFNAGLRIVRATPTQVLEFSGSLTQADYEPAGKVVDNYQGEFIITQILRDNRYFLASTTYKVDKISLIDHSFEQILGYGFKLVETEKSQFDLIPGVSLLKESRGAATDDDWIISVGFLERFEHAFNERVSLLQTVRYRVSVEDTDFWRLETELKIRAALTAHIAITVGGTYTYDNSLGPIPDSVLGSLGGFAPLYQSFRPANKGRLLLETGLEFDF